MSCMSANACLPCLAKRYLRIDRVCQISPDINLRGIITKSVRACFATTMADTATILDTSLCREGLLVQ